MLFRARNAEPTWAAVADFTNYTAWYYNDSIIGGVGGWVDALGMALGAPLTMAPCRTNGSCSNYVAATSVYAKLNMFKITPVTIQTLQPVQTLFGTITTDGTQGPLTPGNFVAWHIVGRTQESHNYNTTNSVIRNIAGIFTDNLVLKVDNDPNRSLGILDIGTVPSAYNPGISVNLADFTDPSYVGGVASYSDGNLGLIASKSPLTTRKSYVVARVK